VAPSISVIARPGPHPAAGRAVATRPCPRGCGGSTVASGAGTPDLATGIQPLTKSGVGGARVDRIARSRNSPVERPRRRRAGRHDGPSRRRRRPGRGRWATAAAGKALGSRVEASGCFSDAPSTSQMVDDPVLLTHAHIGPTPTRTCACLVMKGPRFDSGRRLWERARKWAVFPPAGRQLNAVAEVEKPPLKRRGDIQVFSPGRSGLWSATLHQSRTPRSTTRGTVVADERSALIDPDRRTSPRCPS
jgi:hypothetical protein